LEQAATRTAALAALPVPNPQATPDAGVGATAARRALRIEGNLPALHRPLLVQLDGPATIAAGERPWGLALDSAELVRVSPHNGVDAERLLAQAGARPILVISRDTYRRPGARGLVEQLAARHPDVVLVEMGWPAAWRPAGLRAYVATYGAGQANARAAADALLPD
ncbi:MAG: glycoside hydrolase family 3 protein, partial [Micromonosporaceae bacterium]